MFHDHYLAQMYFLLMMGPGISCSANIKVIILRRFAEDIKFAVFKTIVFFVHLVMHKTLVSF